MEAILALLRVMAATPSNSWAGCRTFGLNDYFERPAPGPEMPREALDAVNRTLTDLGLSKYSVESIVREISGDQGSASYSVTLIAVDQNAPAISARL